MPNLYIIAGPNGAGKTTAAYTLLPEVMKTKEFVNADEIARGLSPFNVEAVAFEAGRIMLGRIENLMNQEVDFAIETTLSTRSYVQTIRRAQQIGYTISLYFSGYLRLMFQKSVLHCAFQKAVIIFHQM